MLLIWTLTAFGTAGPALAPSDARTLRRLSGNNASCIHCALNCPDSLNMHLSVGRMKEMASSGRGLVFCDEIPDACKANRRHKAFLASELEQVDNVFFNEHVF